MKVEYDPARDLLYLWLRAPGTTAATTETVSPGVHADVDREDTLIGLEILDASDVLQDNVQFEVVSHPIPTTIGILTYVAMNEIRHGMQEINVQDQDVAAWLEEAVPRLVRELAPERILLFGSWARRTATRRSDIDVCVIWDTDRSPLDRIGRVLELLSDAPRPVEPVVYTPEEWERMREHVPFVRRIDKEGKVLYERRAVVE